jgi:hypothetical protein
MRHSHPKLLKGLMRRTKRMLFWREAFSLAAARGRAKTKTICHWHLLDFHAKLKSERGLNRRVGVLVCNLIRQCKKQMRIFKQKNSLWTFVIFQYGSDTSFSYTAANCLGIPTKFPAYGMYIYVCMLMSETSYLNRFGSNVGAYTCTWKIKALQL